MKEELSSEYLKVSSGYRLDISEAQHMTFSAMDYMSIWAGAGRRFGTNDPAHGIATVKVIRSYIRAFFDRFLLGRESSLLVNGHPRSIATFTSARRPQ